MGAFDDAIREHLELKRRKGVSEDELKQQEEEALGRGAVRFARPETTAEPAAEQRSVAAEGDDSAPEQAATAEPDAAPGTAETDAETPPNLDEELDPDEVLPDEALEPSIEEDVLEETPDFLEESPEQDSLWFDQRAPKDFDFGD